MRPRRTGSASHRLKGVVPMSDLGLELPASLSILSRIMYSTPTLCQALFQAPSTEQWVKGTKIPALLEFTFQQEKDNK